MKSAFVLVLAAVAVFSVKANGGGDPEDTFLARARCMCGTGYWNPCSRQSSTSTQQIGCPLTNSYLQCTGTSCAVANCTAGQVWNMTESKCDVCRSDMHVRADGQVCVCNQGTTFNFRNNSCVTCPANSVQTADNCTCPKTMVLDWKNNACKACPANSNLTRGQCVCSATQFWNANDWACEDCPGSWVNVSVSRRKVVQVCKCTGANQIFDRQNVKCFNCPTANPVTAADNDNDACLCNTGIRGQQFNMTTKACACERGQQPDTTNTRCVRIPWTTSTTTIKP